MMLIESAKRSSPVRRAPRAIWIAALTLSGTANAQLPGVAAPLPNLTNNGEIVVDYQHGTQQRLALHNPTNWWPIDQDYFLDDFQFRRAAAIPARVDLKTGRVRLRSLEVRAFANEMVIGLMAARLDR